MCKYCTAIFSEGWSQLLEYDDVYQSAISTDSTSTHGFHEEWDDLRETFEG